MTVAPPVRVSDLLRDATGLIDNPVGDVGVAWNRAAAVLIRQAIERTLFEFWRIESPDMRWANWTEKWTAAAPYFADDPTASRLVAQAHYSWEALSECCHHRGYDLGLTEPELRRHLAAAVGLARAVGERIRTAR